MKVGLKQTIFKGDIVRVEAMGVTRTGEALSVDFDRQTGKYMIEIMSVEAGYAYWKQGADGGTAESIGKSK